MLQRAKTNPCVQARTNCYNTFKFCDFSQPNNQNQFFIVFFGEKNFLAYLLKKNLVIMQKENRKNDKTRTEGDIVRILNPVRVP